MSPFSPAINTLISHVSLCSLELQLTMDHSTTCHPVLHSFLKQNFHPYAPLLKNSPLCSFIFPFPLLSKALDQSLIFLYMRKAAILRPHSACFALAQTPLIKLRFTVFFPFFGSFTYGTSMRALRFNREQERTMDDKNSC